MQTANTPPTKPNKTKVTKKTEHFMKWLVMILRHGLVNTQISNVEAPFYKMSLPISYVLDLYLEKSKVQISFQELCDGVDADLKNRVLFTDDTKTSIYATQGHSISCDIEEICKTFVPTLNFWVAHGTYSWKLDSIFKNGLNSGNRKYIHFFSGQLKLDDGFKSFDTTSISYMRKDCDVILIVDYQKAINEGVKFFEADNGVILIEKFLPSHLLTGVFL